VLRKLNIHILKAETVFLSLNMSKKINSKCIKEHNITSGTLKQLDENIRKHYVSIGKGFLKKNSNSSGNKSKK
jgi:hypothetical protein